MFGSTILALAVVFMATSAFASDTAKLSVDGMMCNGCVKSVKQALEKVDGVETAEVDLKSNSATVKYNSKKATLTSMENAVADAGYTAKPATEKNMKQSSDKSKSMMKSQGTEMSD